MAGAVRTAERPAAGTTPRPGGDPLAEPHPTLPRPLPFGSWVTWAAVALIGAQLVVRGWVVMSGSFFEDDLALEGLAGATPDLSADYLLQDYADHLMPGVFVVVKLVTTWAPLQWWAPVLSLLVIQAFASLAVLRLMRALLGNRPVLLLPLSLYLFSPLTLPSFAWWASALNSLPLQLALAWATADALHLVRTGRRRYAVSGTLAVAVGLAFFLKSLVVPWFAFAAVVVFSRLTGGAAPLRSALRLGAPLWWGSAAVIAVWAWAYTALIDPSVVTETVPAGDAVASVGRGLVRGVVPALMGGPWQWHRMQASTPWAHPPIELVALASLAAVVVIVGSVRRRQGAWLVWALIGVHITYSTALMVWGRFTPQLADLLPLTLRHYSDCALVISVAAALILRAPVRPVPALLTARGRRVLTRTAAALFVASSLWSTLTFTRIWEHPPAEDYLATARASLAAAGQAPLLDQPVPDDVVWSAAFPHNLASSVFAPLFPRPPIANWTWDLRMIDDSGMVVPARVEPSYRLTEGQIPGCGHRVWTNEVTNARLDRASYPWEWTLRLTYIASRDGELRVSLSTGAGVPVTVRRGLHTVFVRLSGGGDDLRLSTTTPDLAICLTGGSLGLVRPVG